jgi:transposase
VRARIVLACAAGQSNTQIAAGLAVHRNTVALWQRRFLEFRVDGLLDEPRPGQPRKISDAKVEEVITKTLENAPENAMHWSTRSMATEVGLTQTAVSRICGVRPAAPAPRRVEAVQGPLGIRQSSAELTEALGEALGRGGFADGPRSVGG